MLEINIKENEFYKQEENRFIKIQACTINLEHSLISLAKWESKWHIPYLTDEPKTKEQELDYIRSMIIGTIPSDNVLKTLSFDDITAIKDYVDNPMTATKFSKNKKSTSKVRKEIVTAEGIYSRMFSNNIPIECQKWHLNRLLTLIRVCDLNNSPPQKMSKKESAEWVAEQNAARRARLNTRG